MIIIVYSYRVVIINFRSTIELVATNLVEAEDFISPLSSVCKHIGQWHGTVSCGWSNFGLGFIVIRPKKRDLENK